MPIVLTDTEVRFSNNTAQTYALPAAGTNGNILTSNGSVWVSQAAASQTQLPSLGLNTPAPATLGELRATNNITAFYSSDVRQKENIQPIDNALNIVCDIGGKLFDWTDQYVEEHGGEDGYFIQKKDFGVIAQDVMNVFPLAVRTKQDGMLAVDYEKLCALAFEAIKMLRKEVEELKKSKDEA